MPQAPILCRWQTTSKATHCHVSLVPSTCRGLDILVPFSLKGPSQKSNKNRKSADNPNPNHGGARVMRASVACCFASRPLCDQSISVLGCQAKCHIVR